MAVTVRGGGVYSCSDVRLFIGGREVPLDRPPSFHEGLYWGDQLRFHQAAAAVGLSGRDLFFLLWVRYFFEHKLSTWPIGISIRKRCRSLKARGLLRAKKERAHIPGWAWGDIPWEVTEEGERAAVAAEAAWDLAGFTEWRPGSPDYIRPYHLARSRVQDDLANRKKGSRGPRRRRQRGILIPISHYEDAGG